MIYREPTYPAYGGPRYCWVGEARKVCYSSEDEAKVAAFVAQYDYHVSPKLKPYKCEYGNHWHLTKVKGETYKFPPDMD